MSAFAGKRTLANVCFILKADVQEERDDRKLAVQSGHSKVMIRLTIYGVLGYEPRGRESESLRARHPEIQMTQERINFRGSVVNMVENWKKDFKSYFFRDITV